MGCKNCEQTLNHNDDFCNHCGAKVVRERITIKNLISSLLSALGWDSNFAITLRHLLYKPQVVFKTYINGTRKKYANPFAFFAIILAISLFVFSQFSDQLIEMSVNPDLNEVEINTTKVNNAEVFGFKNQHEMTQAFLRFQMKYYNFFAFLLLPLYTLIAFLVFRKPYNYGEHLVINTYIQSTTTLMSVFVFTLSLISGCNLFGSGVVIIPFLYYCFAYKKAYDLSFGRLLLKILKFVGLLILVLIVPIIFGFILAIVKHQ